MRIIVKAAIAMTIIAGFAGNAIARKKTINIITYNIRYENSRDGINSWKNRNTYLCNFLKKGKFDVLCLQEVLHHQLIDIADALKDYSFVGVGRNDGKTKGEFAPIFYKKTLFDEIESGIFWLSEHPKLAGSIGWDAKQPRIATWIILQSKKSSKKVVVINTHFDDKGRLARQEGLNMILDSISTYSCPVILAGDFNENPNSKLYLSISKKDSLLMDTDLISSRRKGTKYTYHGFGRIPSDKRQKIDYVFVKGIQSVKQVHIPEETPTKGIFLSDHNPILVKLVL